ncbi:MAG: DUF1289 domain-containing protein [Kangiellaceae bacterium]
MNENEAVRSPCVSNCCLDEKDVCLGCYRHVDEILVWRSANTAEKMQILKNCSERKETNN